MVKPKVLVVILHQGWVRPELAEAAVRMVGDERAIVKVIFQDMKPSETNRNMAVKRALEEGSDFLITIDHDVVPLRNPIDLILKDLDVVAMAVPQYNLSDPNFPIYTVAMDKVDNGYKEHKNKNGLEEVDAVGSGCICIARRVLQKIKAPFVRRWDEDGVAILGLDFHFSEKVRGAGFKVWCAYDYPADHFKEVSLLSMLRFKFS